VTHRDIGIVIVTYNSVYEIGACIDAALRSGVQLVVVDNASTDGTVAEVGRRGVHFIANSTNRGFAAAVNQGFAVLKSTYVLLLNPDAVLQSSVEPLCEACDLPGAAGAGGQLLDSAGQPQCGFMVRQLPTALTLVLEALLLNRVWPNNPVNCRYRAVGLDYRSRIQVEQPAGAFLMIRRDVWEVLGGFDEDFHPLWFEDVDFCRRAVDRGYRWYYEPRAVAKHTGGHSISSLSVELRRFYWYRSLLKYTAKHCPPRAFRGVSLAVTAGLVLRVIAETVVERSFKPIAVNGSVVRLASRCFWSGREAVLTGPLQKARK
jgi:N-acetylglucosaminyl-diphospho-decaprenol L-rhamnosyltransferase